jgi:uncharacterized membrane-anchored protein
MQDHPLRQALNDELHGRPGLPVNAPARITHLAFTLAEGDRDPLEAVTKLCDALGVKPPPAAAPHHAVEIENGLLKYERHGEFYRLSVTAEGNGTKSEAIARLPLGWVDELPGLRLVAIHTHILAKSAKPPTEKDLRTLFGHDDVACSKVNQELATVWTDFRIGADGFTRMLIHERGLSPLRLGRVTRRLHEIETYRMMALLAFPLARNVQGELGATERALAAMIEGMATVRGPDEDAKLLAGLTAIARDVEAMSNRTSFRFAAARAYAALVAKRIAELGEERVLNHQRLGVFLDRRFSPAMTTCNAVAERIAGLAARTERASNLLRTRVDIALEAQNQQLLKSMEQRTRQQLMLQETVEGLSVVAISYYLIQIVAKLIEGIPAIDQKLASWVSIPVIIVAVWYGVRRVRKRVHRAGAHPTLDDRP